MSPSSGKSLKEKSRTDLPDQGARVVSLRFRNVFSLTGVTESVSGYPHICDHRVTSAMEGGGPTLSRRNSVRSAGGSRRGSAVIEVDVIQDQASIFGTKKPLKKSKPVSSVKINFMGKPMVSMLHV